ncbi:hypothetical protein EXIGLDRAFT_701752 [Exidia glandulosa HHB12029]|uniref:CBM1 domain-containing protein n=1 Tax=Exidia glandulosa HHB12029 TaxID=1314781 RepID=A0A165LSC7_EXIGL|nr:hypothetical protein EXIGLDRAFT_701752 [Exidia glandulosa HHB12029]
MLAFAVLSALAASSLVRADCAGNSGTQAVWAQCGGMGWTGATTCVNGASFNDVLLDRYFSQITALYNVGLRNFAFLNVPPVDRSPLMLPQSGAATEKTVIADFNAKVKSRAAAFASSNSGAKTYVVDTNTLIGGLLDKPTANGFTDATTYGSQAGVMWCNNYHISPGVHDFVAKLVKTTLVGTGAP